MSSSEAASGDKDGYLLARNQKASIRLNYHHWSVKEILGYHVHPAIPIDQAGMLIADVATGTAIWPIEVSRSLPSADVHGFDISTGQFPHEKRLPSRVHLHQHDAFQPFPLEHQGKFDIVNMRFFLTLLPRPEKVPVILKNLMDLIKPGGYLQWVEPDALKNRAIIPDGVDGQVTKGLVDMVSQRPGTDYSWASDLKKHFAENGLEVVGVDRQPIPDELQIFSHHQMCMVVEEFQTAQLSKDADPEAAQKMQETLDRLRREFEKGVSVYSEYVVTVGKKPM